MLGGSLKEFDYSWDDQDPEQISDLVEGEYDNSLDSIEKHGISNDEDEDYDDSGLCSCGDGGKQRECEDCKHDLECRESHCDNEEHQRVLDFGYPELCECFKTRSEETCLGCGHATTCESEELEFCFTEPHSELLGFSIYFEECDCQRSQFTTRCLSCQHKTRCRDAIRLCRDEKFHFSEESGGSISTQIVNATVERSIPSAPNTVHFTRQGAYWTQQEDQQLIASYNSSQSDQEIALSLGRTVPAIRARLVKVCFDANGVQVSSLGSNSERSGEGWTEEEDAQLRSLQGSGSMLEEISQSLGRTQLSIAYRQVTLRLVTPGNLETIQYRKPGA